MDTQLAARLPLENRVLIRSREAPPMPRTGLPCFAVFLSPDPAVLLHQTGHPLAQRRTARRFADFLCLGRTDVGSGDGGLDGGELPLRADDVPDTP